MPNRPLILITATVESTRGIPRVRVNESYVRAIADAGLLPLIAPSVSPAIVPELLASAHGILLTGGEDLAPALYGATPHPATDAPNEARDAFELALARTAHERRIPTLAICRGVQLVNVALGGTLVQDIPTEWSGALDHDPEGQRCSRVHDVRIQSGSVLARAARTERARTNSSHHQAVNRVASGLAATAWTSDAIIEGIESATPDWWMLGVQWHPEDLIETSEAWDRNLFEAFARATARA